MFAAELSDPSKTLALLSALEIIIPRWRSEIDPRTRRRLEKEQLARDAARADAKRANEKKDED
jgi:hypothetical protein